MSGYINGKVEIWYGDNPPSNQNVLWQKRIITGGVESTIMYEFNNHTGLWQVHNIEASTGPITGLTKDQVGLGNVDNTSDANKPVSTATQTQLNAKQATLVSGTNIKTINGSSILGSGDLEIESSNLNGTNYVMVYGVGTPAENAVELQAAYDAAKNMPRYLGTITSGTVTRVYGGQTWNVGAVYYKSTAVIGNGSNLPIEIQPSTIITEAEAKSTRTTVIVAPGDYTFGVNKFTVNASGIDVVSLTGNADVKLDGISVSADNIFIKGIDSTDEVFEIINSQVETIVDTCVGPSNSFGGTIGAYGTFINCISDSSSFGGSSTVTDTGRIQYCRLTTGNWADINVENGGHISFCINGDGSAAANV